MGEWVRRCLEHGDAIVYEQGGDDMPTIRGRWYCPTCQDRIMTALDTALAANQESGA